MSNVRANPVFLLAGNGPYANRGCEAIVRGTVELLSERFPNCSFILSSFGESAQTEAQHEIDTKIEHRPPPGPRPIQRFGMQWWMQRVLHTKPKKPKHPFKTQVDAMSDSDCALLLGGDNYTLDYGRPTRFVEMNEALLSTGKPVVLWGASAGPFSKDPEFEFLIADHFRKLTLIMARETETAAYLASIGVEENVRLVADPAFVMKPVQPNLTDEMMNFLQKSPIGLNLSPLAGLYHAGGREEWATLAMECIRELVASDMAPVLLVPHVTIKTDYDNDYAFLQTILTKLNVSADQIAVLPPTFTAAEYKWAISKLRAFAGCRMHATVASMSSLVPTISIGYSMKSRGINQDIFGHQEWLLPMDKLSPRNLVDRTRAALNQSSEVVEQLGVVMPTIRRRAESAADHLISVVDKSGANG